MGFARFPNKKSCHWQLFHCLNRFEIFLICSNRGSCYFLRRAADYLSCLRTFVYIDSGVNAFIKHRGDCLIFRKGKVIQIGVMLDAVQYQLPDDGMCITEGNIIT